MNGRELETISQSESSWPKFRNVHLIWFRSTELGRLQAPPTLKPSRKTRQGDPGAVSTGLRIWAQPLIDIDLTRDEFSVRGRRDKSGWWYWLCSRWWRLSKTRKDLGGAMFVDLGGSKRRWWSTSGAPSNPATQNLSQWRASLVKLHRVGRRSFATDLFTKWGWH
jgi:hypothetical protein